MTKIRYPSRVFLILLLGFGTFSSPAAFAGGTDNHPAPQPRMIYRKKETQEFSGSRLKGRYKKPELSYIYQRKGLRAEKIVNVPENFDDEILSAANQL